RSVNRDADEPSAKPPSGTRDAGPGGVHASLEAFFADVGPRAYRFAELGLRHREDALDAVQDAMIRMLRYEARPAAEWTPLFWRILRSRIVDLQRRRSFRLRWIAPANTPDDGPVPDWADDGPDPS